VGAVALSSVIVAGSPVWADGGSIPSAATQNVDVADAASVGPTVSVFAGAADAVLQPVLTLTQNGNVVNIALDLENPNTRNIAELDIHATVPAGMTVLETTSNGAYDGTSVGWDNTGMGPIADISGFEYKLDTGGNSGTVQVVVNYWSDVGSGTVTAVANIGQPQQ